MAACWSLIDFDATDRPPWVKEEGAHGGARQDGVPSVRDMIKDIVGFQEQWRKLPIKDQEKLLLMNDRLVTYITHVCVEEDLGLQCKSDTRTLLQSTGTNSDSRSKEEKETLNLHNALMHLRKLLDRESPDSDSVVGLIDIDQCILETHRIIMDGVVDSRKTPGGSFSTQKRYADYKEERHDYPDFETVEEAEKRTQNICDRYNALITEIKDLKDPCDKMYKVFKCGAWLLFNLVSLHPFSDGNGRLCRLLCSYALGVATPFPSPIYNVYSPTVKSDYLDSIISARKREHQYPKEMTTLIIESNWCAWKAILGLNDSCCEDADYESKPTAEATESEDEPMPADVEREQDSVCVDTDSNNL